MNTSILSLRGLSKTFLAAGAAAVMLSGLAAPALADGWHDGWRRHEWHEHHRPHVFVAPGYYAPPRVVYAPPPPVVYAPPPRVIYAPPPPPVVYAPPAGVNVVVPLTIR